MEQRVLMAEMEEIGYFLAINPLRQNSITKMRLNHGSIRHLYQFTTAWSRDQEKIYVQHRLKEHGAEVWQWFENGAYFYICGDKTYMASVHRALIEIAMEHGGMSEEDATHFIEKTMMKEQKRYLRDVY